MQGTYGDFGAAVAPHSYLRNDVIFYDAGIGPRPITGGLDPGFDQDLWMDRLTLGGFSDARIFGGKIRHRSADPVRVRPDGRAESGWAAVRLFRVATRPRLRGSRDQAAARLGIRAALRQVFASASWRRGARTMTARWCPSAVTIGRSIRRSRYTYLSDSGWDVSATVGIMINLENSLPGPNYETGDEAHIDALIGKHFGEHFALGVAGYWYHQLDRRRGSDSAAARARLSGR